MIQFDQGLLDILEKEGRLSSDKRSLFEQELSSGQTLLEDLLVNHGIITSEEFLKYKSDYTGIKHVSLDLESLDKSAFEAIPQASVTKHKMLGFKYEGNTLQVAMVNPYDLRAVEYLEFLTQQKDAKYEIFLVSQDDFDEAVKRYKSLDSEVADVLSQDSVDTVQSSGDEREDIANAPISKVVSVIIRHGVEADASDIHIEPVDNQTLVRYRIDGVLHTSLVLPGYLHASIIARIKVLARMKLDETRIPQDGRIKLRVEDRQIDLRVSTFPLLDKEKVTMRILDRSKEIPTLAKLGFRGTVYDVLMRNIKKPHGMLLVTGPTGSGKTTTLYTLINEINDETRNIVTLEDPIEYEIASVNQSQVQPRVGYTFASGLRSLLRQDPDVIMVGEIRDNETAEMAVHAGLTGHLLFSTLHTNNAYGAIPRLIDMEVESFLLASTINAVLAQRLVRKICHYCKEEVQVPAETVEHIKKLLSTVDAKDIPDGITLDSDLVFYHGKGCSHCGNVGFKGRTVIAEAIEVNDNMRGMINEQVSEEAFHEKMLEEKLITMEQYGYIIALMGLTTIDEVLRVVQESSIEY